MTINEMMKNPELLADIAEDLEDFDVNAEVCYEVWALGYDENDEITDAELCMFTSTDRDDAINYAKKATLADVVYGAGNGPCANSKVFRIAIEVETVVPVDDDLVNIGTVYSKTVWEVEEPEEPEDDDDDDVDVVELPEGHFEVLPDNTLKVKYEVLRSYNKNDKVFVAFSDDPDSFPIEYKIVSKVVYEDGDYYHCVLDY